MRTVRCDLSQYYPAKALFERILGRSAFRRVKDYGSLSAWRENYTRFLRALGVAVEATVQVADAEWKKEVNELLAHGVQRLKTAKSVDQLHAAAVATLGELTFLQLGFVPRGHYRAETIPLSPRYWRMDAIRTVQYVQTNEQRATQLRLSKPKPPNGEP